MGALKNSTVEKLRKSAKNWLQLFFAPLVISLVTIQLANISTGDPLPSWLWYAALISLLISVLVYMVGYTEHFEESLAKISKARRKGHFKKPRILIFDGTIHGESLENPAIAEHTDRTPTDWRSSLETTGVDVRLGPTDLLDGDTRFDVVINPFGEVYPEEDMYTHSTSNKIRDYVWNGGVYVHVAGNPFWYKFDTNSGRREEAGRIESMFGERPTWYSLLHDIFPNLGTSGEDSRITDCVQTEDELARFGNIQDAGGSRRVGIFRHYPIGNAQLISMLRDEPQERCLIGASLFGEGAFILCGLFMHRNNLSFEKALSAIRGWIAYENRGRQST